MSRVILLMKVVVRVQIQIVSDKLYIDNLYMSISFGGSTVSSINNVTATTLQGTGVRANASAFYGSEKLRVGGDVHINQVYSADGTSTIQFGPDSGGFGFGTYGVRFVGGPVGNEQGGATLRLFTANGNMLTISRTGGITFNAYGAGTLATNSSGLISASDERVKTIQPKKIEDAISIVKKLNPVYYKWKDGTDFQSDDIELGFTAQNVKSAIPEACPCEENGDKLLNYHDRAIIAVLVKAIQEQQEQIDKLTSQLNFYINK